jgi:uncharacterized protein (TIGR02588 family)
MNKLEEKTRREKTKLEKNPLEWAVFAVSLAVVLATVGFLAWDAATADGSAPDLQVELGPPEARSGAFAVPVTVHNQGDQTAEGVHIEITLEIPGTPPETAEIEMAFVPRRSQREGWATFRRDPRQGRLAGRAAGYEKP